MQHWYAEAKWGKSCTDNYDNLLPDFPLPILIALTFISVISEMLKNLLPAVPLEVNEYVQDGHASSI